MGIGRRRVSVAGFNLLEVLLASLLFAISFAGIAAGWRFHELSLQKYRNRNAAKFLLQQEMERLMAHSYYGLEAGAGTSTRLLQREIDGVASPQEFTVESQVVENAAMTVKDVTVPSIHPNLRRRGASDRRHFASEFRRLQRRAA